MKNRSTPALVLAMGVLAACATQTPDWRQVQRDRLERAHRDVPLQDALRDVIAKAPAATMQQPQQPQQPVSHRHIDQREPPLPGTGPRPFRQSVRPMVVTAAYGVGRADVRVHGSRLDDATDAQFARLTVDAATGAAVHGDLTFTDDHLFAGTRFNDGVAPAWADASLVGLDLFPNQRFDTDLGAVRLGAFVDWQQLDHQRSRVQREWLSVGPRVAWEPSLQLFGESSHGLELFGRAAADIGATMFTEDHANGRGRDTTWRWAGDVTAGLRARFGDVDAELGYRWHRTSVQRTDSDLLGDPGHTEFGSEQLFLGFGVSY